MGLMIETADVVISLCGRDMGKRFLVIGTQDGYSLLADGKIRRIEKPKRKKNKHFSLEGKCVNPVANKLLSGEKVTNNEIRRALAEYAAALEKKEVC
jgi:ribosomal protein L14E/L6E/L27E